MLIRQFAPFLFAGLIVPYLLGPRKSKILQLVFCYGTIYLKFYGIMALNHRGINCDSLW